MVELYKLRFFDYEKNRELVLEGKSFEMCCIELGYSLSQEDKAKISQLLQYGFNEKDIKRVIAEHPDCSVE